MTNQRMELVLCIIVILTNNIPHANCQASSFICKVEGGPFEDTEDCHGFYTCDSDLVATKGSCTEFGHYDPVSTCIFEPCPNPTSPTATQSPSTGTQAPVTGTQPTLSGDFTCIAAGYYPDTTDCHSYYSCDKALVPGRRSCTQLGFFNMDTKECEMGSCDGPTSSPTDSPVTDNPATPSDYSCISAGYYKDPDNCKAYYQCSDALVPTRGVCMGGGGHFSEQAGGCVLGPC